MDSSAMFNLIWVVLRGALNIFVVVNGILALTSADINARDRAYSLLRYAYVMIFLIALPFSILWMIISARYMFIDAMNTVIILGQHLINLILVVFLIICKPEKPVRRVNLQNYDMVAFTSTGHRFVHYLLDSLFILPLLINLGNIIVSARQMQYDRDLLSLIVFFMVILNFLLYYFLSEAMFGQTFGKMLTKSCVVTNGVEFSNGRMFVRTLCRFIPFDRFSFLFGANWHDRVSATAVVYVDSWESAFEDKTNSEQA
jgi:hypothetical protein